MTDRIEPSPIVRLVPDPLPGAPHLVPANFAGDASMSGKQVDLDEHRGMAAQKATELRRLVNEVAADQAKLKARQHALEKFLIAAPAADWTEAVEKTRYLLSIFATTSEAQDPRRQTLISNLLNDLDRLLAQSTTSRSPD
jgi:hypothetical protein